MCLLKCFTSASLCADQTKKMILFVFVESYTLFVGSMMMMMMSPSLAMLVDFVDKMN